MIPIPYLLLAKIGAVIALLLGVYLTGRHQGEDAVQADWDRSKAEWIDAQSKLILEHARDMEDLRRQQQNVNIEVAQNHERSLDAIQKKYDADLAATRASGGLRVSRSICSNPTTTGTEAPGNGGHDADASGTVALPDTLTRDLFDFAAEADRTTEIARSCQAWITKNGFYNLQ